MIIVVVDYKVCVESSTKQASMSGVLDIVVRMVALEYCRLYGSGSQAVLFSAYSVVPFVRHIRGCSMSLLR